MDFVGIAGELEKDFYATSFGVRPDYSPASLLVLDAYLDEIWGTAGKRREDPAWKMNRGQELQTMMVGCYAGEVVCRQLGGQWQHDPQKQVVHATVFLPRTGYHVLPIAKALKRITSGADDRLYAVWELAVQHCPPGPTERAAELAAYRAHAEHIKAAPAPARDEIAAALTRRIPVDAAPAGQGQPAPGTLLAACPSCKRPAVPGKVACTYCGGALVVPATCAKCQRKNAPKAKACMYCRAPL